MSYRFSFKVSELFSIFHPNTQIDLNLYLILYCLSIQKNVFFILPVQNLADFTQICDAT